ncbi:MAG: diguanylate cyclase domain-containing protein [Nitrospirota bacterium]
MRDEARNKAELVDELKKLRRQVSDLQRSNAGAAVRKGTHQAQNLKKLLIASREMTTTTDLRKLYRKIVNISKSLLNLDFSTLMILSGDRSRLVIEDTIGFPKSMIGTFSLVKGQGLATYVVKTKRHEVVVDFKREKRFEVPPVVYQKHITSAVSVPMMLEKEVFGVLIGHTLKKRTFSEDEISLYQSIANQGAVAIKNAMHIEALRENEEYLKTILDAVQTAILVIDAETHEIITVNPVAVKMIGAPREEIVGKVCHKFICPTQAGACPITDGGYTIDNSERILLRADREKVPIIKTVNLVMLNGRRYLIESLTDITERKRMEEAIKYQAYHDLLTNLPNRMLFMDRLGLALTQVQRNQKMLAVLFLDIDYFKNINDSLGHTIGDQLLRDVAKRLKACIRKSDTVARIGGDEFILLLSPINDIGDAVIIAEKILSVFQKPFKIDGNTLRVTTSIGLSLYPGDGETAEALLKNADIAMYYAKERGRNRYQCFNAAMRS